MRFVLTHKGGDKSAAVIVWDREDYIREASKQLEDKEVYLEVPNDLSALLTLYLNLLKKIRKRGDTGVCHRTHSIIS